MSKVCVVGLGVIGEPVAKYISKYFKVYGYDIIKKKIAGIRTFTDWGKIPKCDVYVICTPTKVIEEAAEKIPRTSLLVIESTSPVGTCRRLSEKYGFKYVVHCPHRYFPDEPEKRGVNQPRVLGVINSESLSKGFEFYTQMKIIPLYVSPIETAEMCKIAENAYRFVQIAFVEELRMIAEANGVSYEELREACNTKWNISLLEARDGIGQICLPQDIRLLAQLSNWTPLLHGAILADETYKKWREKQNG